MPAPFKVSVVEVNRGPVLLLDFTITGSADKSKKVHEFNIDDTAEIRLKFTQNKQKDGADSNWLSTTLVVRKHISVINSTVKLNVSCEALKYSEQMTCPVDLTYGKEMGMVRVPNSRPYSLQMTMIVNKKDTITFAKLYADTDLTDFHLSTEEGSVAVHRACLAMHSNMFYTMLLGKWKETAKGRIELKGVSLQTLEHLKQYIYLGTLPEDVRQLLLFAKCYLLDNLKQDCLMKLAQTVSSKNLYELQEFACDNNIIELSRMLLQLATNVTVQGAHKIQSKGDIEGSGCSKSKKKKIEAQSTAIDLTHVPLQANSLSLLQSHAHARPRDI